MWTAILSAMSFAALPRTVSRDPARIAIDRATVLYSTRDTQPRGRETPSNSRLEILHFAQILWYWTWHRLELALHGRPGDLRDGQRALGTGVCRVNTGLRPRPSALTSDITAYTLPDGPKWRLSEARLPRCIDSECSHIKVRQLWCRGFQGQHRLFLVGEACNRARIVDKSIPPWVPSSSIPFDAANWSVPDTCCRIPARSRPCDSKEEKEV